jgi:DNA invertase Pin-like site-specific DNA recombinase
MMLAASQRKFDLLLFWALDRLSREGIAKTLGYLEQLRTWGCGWRSYTQTLLDTGNEMTNGVVLCVLAAVAKARAHHAVRKNRGGLQRARRAGKRLGRRAVQVDVKTAHRLRAERMGLRGVARRLGVSVNTLQRSLKAG